MPERVSSCDLVGDAHEPHRPLERAEHAEQRLGLADRRAQVALAVLDEQRRVHVAGEAERRDVVEVRVGSSHGLRPNSIRAHSPPEMSPVRNSIRMSTHERQVTAALNRCDLPTIQFVR